MTHKRIPLVATLAIVVAVLAAGSDGTGTALAVASSITSPDNGVANVGAYASLALDGAGNPVVSYYDKTNGNLKLLHCDDPNCAEDESGHIATPDTNPPGNVHGDPEPDQGLGLYTSLRLDAAGNPVIGYHDHDYARLKILHCDDPNCAGVENPTVVDTGGLDSQGIDGHHHAGSWLSLALDAFGRPVVSYRDGSIDPGMDGNLRVMHCNDVNCVGYDESIVTLEIADDVAREQTSIALDSAGDPVVSYWDATLDRLKVLHCNDANCAGDESSNIRIPDSQGGGYESSLKLDPNGNPVVSYYNESTQSGALKVLHCNDSNCDGGDESIAQLYPAVGYVNTPGYSTSLTLDGPIPVISHAANGSRHIFITRCGDANCASGASLSLAKVTDGGWFTSLALDSLGRPVVAYARGLSGLSFVPLDLSVWHCGDIRCGALPGTALDSDGDGCPDAKEAQTASGSEMSGGLRDKFNGWDYFNPTHDGFNRVDDILAVVQQYFQDQYYPTPPYPPNTPNPLYTTETDRTQATPYQWSLGPPSGAQRVDDILAAVHQYFHDCS